MGLMSKGEPYCTTCRPLGGDGVTARSVPTSASMRRMHSLLRRLAPLGVLIGAVACSKSTSPSPVADKSAAVAGTAAQTSKAATGPKAATAKRRKARKAGGKAVVWNAPIAWKSWDAALTQAKAESKPIMVFVYADW